jgi:quinol monooxygenase YgiN
MLRHIVMWTVNQPADVAPFAAELRSCAGLVPGMREFEVGMRVDGLAATHDVVLVSTFDDAAALAAYTEHPHHQAVSARLSALRKSRSVLDYFTD